ncbi:MAG: ABC transporter ATP-binding protein [Bacteroidales bacterium]|jgi:lipoprotein-releasing system ATP-binding protein|nr:ABC transporter ATP-binding protein [Bacteroidales bacterium]
MIHIKNIEKPYGELKVLKGISLDIEKSSITSIVGASGAGKTTLLHIIGTLLKPDAGEIIINGVNTAELNEKSLAKFRNKEIGFVFQFHHLLPEFTAIENVCIPAFISGMSKKDSYNTANQLLINLGLKNRINHKPSELSGGEKQRVAIARALVNKPAVVLADEPSGNLDSKNAAELYKIFFELREKTGQTFVVVTHNEQHAKQTDKLFTIKDGIIFN